jgi:hypothetical protein
MKLGERIRGAVEANPLAWLLAAALLIAVYGNWQLGKTLTRVCELAIDPDDAIVVHRHPKTPQEQLNKICAERLADPEPVDDH